MDKDKKEKFSKLATVMLWVFGLAAWSQATEFSLGLMNKSDNYLFYMGLFILTAVNATAFILMFNEIMRLINKK